MPRPPPSVTIRLCVTPIPCSKPKTDEAAVLPCASTSGERITRNCSLNHGRQAVSSSRVGVRLAGGRHFTTFVTKHSARESPTSSRISWKSSRPLRPMKGSPPSSSSRPGASPITINAGVVGPEPTTTRWRLVASAQRVHVGSSAKARLISVHENTGHAGPNTAEDLPGNGTRSIRPLVGRDRLVTLATQEDDLVAELDGVVTAVDHQHVHGDHPRQRVARGVDEDFGTGVEEAPGVA